ncbi:MAG: hypothetical protein M3R04_03245 [bacterium]|nr:hypothetical protein [bacterium]
MKHRKGLAFAIMSKMAGGKGKDSEEEGYEKEESKDEDDGMGAKEAARSVRKAIESGDDSALAEALKDFIDIC